MRHAPVAPRTRRQAPDDDPASLRSPAWCRFFERIMARRMRSAFHAVRLAHPGVPAFNLDRPVVVYANHPSWWDAAILLGVIPSLFRSHKAFAPIDATALERYRFMRKLGLFGVRNDTFRGAAAFLHRSRTLLDAPDTLLCITPQGSFVDTRQRPLEFKSGLERLLATVPRVTMVPLALEYPFWSENTPEALLRFGDPFEAGFEVARWPADSNGVLCERLAATMDALADDALSRDESRFRSLFEGSAGVGGVYDGWRRLLAWRSGRRFDAPHGPSSSRAPR